MNQSKTVNLAINYILCLEDVFNFLKSIVALRKNRLLKGETTDEAIETFYGKRKTLVLMLQKSFKVEVILQNLIIRHLSLFILSEF